MNSQKSLLLQVSLLLALVLSQVVSAGSQSGYVFSRTPVLDPETGAEIWGEYDPVSGQYLQDIGVATGELDRNNVSTLSAQQFRGYIDSYNVLKQSNPTLELLTSAEYNQRDFLTANDLPINPKPTLRPSTTHVAVRPVDQTYSADIILAEYPVNPTTQLQAAAFSLLVNEEGEIVRSTANRIGIKAGFFRDANGNVKETDESGSYRRDYSDEVLGGVPHVEIEGYDFSRGFTDSEGRFKLNFNYIPCPMAYYSIDGYATAKLESRRFNPKMQSVPYPYFIERFYTVSCTPDMPFIVPFMGPMPITMGSPSIYPGRLDFPVDTMVLSGTAFMSDTQGTLLPVADKTEYVTQPATLARTVNDYFDYDGDGQNEAVVKGYLKDTPNPDTGVIEKVFTTEGVDTVDAKLHLQGVYLSSGSRIPGQDAPDFTRAMDWSTNFIDEGMVKTISESDLRNTDLYVFRLSDGKLISERLGLAPDDWQWSDELGASEQTSRFFYHTYMRGYYGDLFHRIKGTYVNELNFGDWQAKSGINPELHQRQADHLKPGDRVELIAINRATGYLGSVQTTMQAAGSDGGLGRDLSWDIAPIKLQPPNLKIWVDRQYNIKEGLRKGTIIKDQIIGYEGAALSSDNLIALSTEWLKPDGTDFPVSTDTASSDYGYTGRVAFLSGDNQIVSGSNVGVAQFPIKPGKHLQIIQLPNGANSNQHFYIQVSGEPATGSPIFGSAAKSANFDSTGVHDGKLKARPDRFVPFMVPVFDEQNTELQRQAYRQVVAANSGQTYEKPDPIYQWVYRPEFQYSLYDLSIDSINRYTKDDTAGEDILNSTKPIITSSDDLIEILYNLDITKYTPVDYFNTGEEKELIFAIGEQEVRAKINEDDKIEFTNLEHLASLDPEDYLTIRLFTNNDAGNLLWEYAFEKAIPITLSRTVAVGSFDSDVNNDGIKNVTDSYQEFKVKVNSPSMVTVELLDKDQNPIKQLIAPESVTPDDYRLFVTYEDVASSIDRQVSVDYYIRVKQVASQTGKSSSRLYEGNLRYQTTNEMLGQVLQHDVLIQRGSVNLQRQDISLKGVGPQLSFIRSYTNVNKSNNADFFMGAGWNHNHNIYVKIHSEGPEPDRFANNLPKWLLQTRDNDKPKLIAKSTLGNPDITPLMVEVSNGGLFYYQNNKWHSQRGNHGQLTSTYTDEAYRFTYRSKDGTTYQFMPIQDEDKTRIGRVTDITDRNGNALSYTYGTSLNQEVLTEITDTAGRKLFLNYELIDGFSRLTSVTSSESVGIKLDFLYYDKSTLENASLPLTHLGAMYQAKRDTFTEDYLYELNGDDDEINLQTVVDANGHATQYQYYQPSDVPPLLKNYVRGLTLPDVVKAVVYPSEGPTGDKATFVYDVGSENKRVITDLRGKVTTYTLNDFGNPKLIQEPLNKTTAMTWSIDLGEDDNVLRKRTDEFGAVTEYQYDAQGNVTSEKDPYGKIITQTWDQSFGVLTSRTDKNGYKTLRTIDAKGNVKEEKQDATVNGSDVQVVVTHDYYTDTGKAGLRKSTIDGNTHTTKFDYDQYGLLASIDAPEGSRTTFVNDARGRTTQKTDARGKVWLYTYDNLDRLDISTDPAQNTVDYDYDAKGNKKKETHIDTYAAGTNSYKRTLTLTYDYDKRDRVEKVNRTGNTAGLSGGNIADNQTYAYDENSNIISEKDWNGNTTTHTYDDLNRIKITTNAQDDRTIYAYEFVGDNGLKKTITDYEGRVSVEHYDLLGRLSKVDLPLVGATQYSRTYEYDNSTSLIKETDENGHSTQYTYDGRYLKTSRTNALSKQAVWKYDANGNLISAADENGAETKQSFDKQNRLLEKLEPENHKWQYAYDFNGNLTSVIDPWGYQTKTEYDAVNQPNLLITPDGNEIVSYTLDGLNSYRKDPEGRETTQLYTVDGRLISQTDGVGRTTLYSYDNNGNATSVNVSWANTTVGPTSVTTTNTYDSLNRLKTVKEADRGLITYEYDKVGNLLVETRPDNRIATRTYDELNRVATVKDALNKTTTFKYDGVGNVTSVVNRRGFETTSDYDELNRLILVTDAKSQTLSYNYDDVGNVLTQTDKRGTATTNTYDSLNRLLTSTKDHIRLVLNTYDIGLPAGHKQSITDANGNSVVSTFNWRGQVTKTDLPGGNGFGASTMLASYDKSGFKTKQTDEQGIDTLYSYYDDGNLKTVTNGENEVTSYVYDLFANQAKVTTPKGNVTTSTYDKLNRLVSVLDALNNETRFEYDDNDNLTDQYRPGAGAGDSHVQYLYDVNNQKKQIIQHKSGGSLTTSYGYDDEGNLTQITDAKDQVFSHTYDELNRLKLQTYPPGSDISQIATGYDANNNIETITETKSGGVTELTENTYDLLDRLESTTQRGHSIGYSYDDNGNRLSVVSSGGSTTYTYDSRNRLSTATGDGITTYSYFPNNWKQRVEYANQTEAVYDYDKAGRVKAITNQKKSGGGLISSFTYAYDDNGNRITQVETQNGFAASKQQTTEYTYDALDRMESYTITDQDTGNTSETVYTFYASYDRETEVVTDTINGVPTVTTNRQYAYDETNWLTEITDQNSNNAIVYSYDNNGNTLRKVDTISIPTEQTDFTYNSRDMLVQVTRGPPGNLSNQGTYDYNYAGMRIRHLGSERGDIEYLYDGQSILEEVQNNTSNLVAHYRYADRLISLTTPSESQFYHFATLGTTANLSDASGNVAKSYRTDPFGEITHQEGTSVNKQVFTGQEHDELTGLIYFGARFYDPDTARFITQDSYLGEPGTPPSLHRYLYAYGNPTVYIDPTGHASLLASGQEFDDFGYELYNEGKYVQAGVVAAGSAFYRVGTGFFSFGLFDEANDAITTTDTYGDAASQFGSSVADTAKEAVQDYAEEGLITGTATVAGKLACGRMRQACDTVIDAGKKAYKKLDAKLTKESSSSLETAVVPDDSVGAMRVKGSKVETETEIRERLNEKFGRSGDLNADINSRGGYNSGLKDIDGYQNKPGYTLQGEEGARRWKSTEVSNLPKEIRNQKAANSHGNTIDQRPTDIYIRHDRDGNRLKVGVAGDSSQRYPKYEEIELGKSTDKIGTRPREQAIKIERWLDERNDFPESYTSWSGKRDPSSPKFDPNYVPYHLRKK